MANLIITVRFIRSFEHRNIKHVVYKNLNPNITAQSLLEFLIEDVKKRPDLPLPFKKYEYDTLKISHKPFGAKTSDPVINTINDEELILNPELSLSDNGVVDETEISCFKMVDYEAYKESKCT